MKNCIFCKIVRGEVPSKKITETDDLLLFRDAYPQAPEHLLVVPKQHIVSLFDVFPDQAPLITEMFRLGVEVARAQMPRGFRSVINSLEGGGQTVFHLHLHLIGGGQLAPRFA